MKEILRGAAERIAYKAHVKRTVSVPNLTDFKIFSVHRSRLSLKHETLLLALLSNIKEGEVVYDIGANVGLYSIAISKYQPKARVYAFEPNPDAFSRMNANLRLNKVQSNVEPMQTAVSDVDAQQDFIMSTMHERSSFFKENAMFGGEHIKKVIKVDGLTIDTICGILPPPQHIKIDAEGSEAIILAGAEKALRKHKPYLYIEPHSFDLEDKISMMLQMLDYDFENFFGHYLCYPKGAPQPSIKALTPV